MNPFKSGLMAMVAVLMILTCGGSSEQGNSRVMVTGHISVPEKIGFVELQLVPEGYTPWTNETSLFYRTITDSAGNYEFNDVSPGNYYLNVSGASSSLRIIRGPFTLDDASEHLGNDTLVPAAHITAAIAPITGDSIVGLYVKGTDEVIPVSGTNVTVSMPSVPAGEVNIMAIVRSSQEPAYSSTIFCAAVQAVPGDTVNISYRNLPPAIATRPEDLCSWFYPGILYTDTIAAADPEKSPVRFAIFKKESPENAFSIDPTTGIITWVPDEQLLYSESYFITIAATDTQGAYSTIRWKITRETQTIQPASPVGMTVCKPDTFYTYALDSVVCASAAGRYRFAWGDGDTSLESSDSIALHFWRDTGSFFVTVQAHCPDDLIPSEWSTALVVQVNGKHATDSRVKLNAPSQVNVFDTVRVSAVADLCAGARYRFYLNATAVSVWIDTPSIAFVAAERGQHQLSVSVMCDSLHGRVISSPPVNLNVIGTEPYGTCTPHPTAEGIDSYSTYVEINMYSSACSDFGTDCQYRCCILNLRTARVVGDTTAWVAFDETQTVSVTSITGLGVRAQVRCMQDTGFALSDWSPPDSVR